LQRYKNRKNLNALQAYLVYTYMCIVIGKQREGF
jgi:hypothetical protein